MSTPTSVFFSTPEEAYRELEIDLSSVSCVANGISISSVANGMISTEDGNGGSNEKNTTSQADLYTACKKAFRRLSLVRHPDKGGTKEAFQKLLDAWDYIKDISLQHAAATVGKGRRSTDGEKNTAREEVRGECHFCGERFLGSGSGVIINVCHDHFLILF